MKTIKEAAVKYSNEILIAKFNNEIKKEIYDAFLDGVKFAQRWIPVEEEMPELIDRGYDEHGLKYTKSSESIFIKTKSNEIAMGFICENDGWLVDFFINEKEVTHWRPIEFE